MSESIFPFISAVQAEEYTVQKAVPREYAWDFRKNEFIMENGKFTVVEGAEAIKIWIYKMLRTPRYRYLIYSWDYGQELENLIGDSYSKGTLQNEVNRLLEEALSINPNIKGTSHVEVIPDGDRLDISFTAITDYGEVNINV